MTILDNLLERLMTDPTTRKISLPREQYLDFYKTCKHHSQNTDNPYDRWCLVFDGPFGPVEIRMDSPPKPAPAGRYHELVEGYLDSTEGARKQRARLYFQGNTDKIDADIHKLTFEEFYSQLLYAQGNKTK